jgi:hypothetical protein
MTDKVFHITVAILLGAMALAGLAIAGATAVPLAAPRPAVPLAAPVREPQTGKVTNPAILGNLERNVERGGYGCPSLVSAYRLSDDEYGRVEFYVACLVGTNRGAYYRVVFPPWGPPIVRPDKF